MRDLHEEPGDLQWLQGMIETATPTTGVVDGPRIVKMRRSNCAQGFVDIRQVDLQGFYSSGKDDSWDPHSTPVNGWTELARLLEQSYSIASLIRVPHRWRGTDMLVDRVTLVRVREGPGHVISEVPAKYLWLEERYWVNGCLRAQPPPRTSRCDLLAIYRGVDLIPVSLEHLPRTVEGVSTLWTKVALTMFADT